jgi:splicing factor 1
MATGANTTPLGRLHPILAAKVGESSPSAVGSTGSKDPELKRHLEAAKRAASALFPEEPARKKRKSRWASETVRTAIPGLPTIMPANMNEQQQQLYILHLKIEETSRQLRSGDLGIRLNQADRSPSPEPIYSHDGKRLNTREVRTRKKLEDQRHDLILEATKLNPEYRPPTDYKAPNRKIEDKVFIPQEHHPETNFVGLLIGPRYVNRPSWELRG